MHLREKQKLKKTEQKKFKKKEKKREQIHYLLVILAMIFCIVNFTFYDDNTIGHDVRYIIYVFCLPLVIGILFFGIYRREFLIKTYLSFKETYAKIYVIGFYLLQGIIVSYLSFGQIANVMWNYINKKEAAKNKIEIINCNVTGFYTKKNPDISFEFKNETEVFEVNSETNRKNYNRNPKDYQLEITVQKGIWNYYIVKHWELKKI
ncbi:putative integral membrane protein [Flavobacterium sp. HSC-32F16]|uniref:hypothetical protein n=1 Tax=Flavobacterium sp. HSC-32F16 TaxID=2910964 RepID=UPI0020A575F6|nr:hypothetical protein [Flavobacterium sp. HSC-32F16]MCP2029343.1 putative integral membrane protein [Flavobacterium sp. HSC-32F16]